MTAPHSTGAPSGTSKGHGVFSKEDAGSAVGPARVVGCVAAPSGVGEALEGEQLERSSAAERAQETNMHLIGLDPRDAIMIQAFLTLDCRLLCIAEYSAVVYAFPARLSTPICPLVHHLPDQGRTA